MEAGGFPIAPPDPFDPATQAFYAANAAGILGPLLVPQALGVQLFTVLPDDKDQCKNDGWQRFGSLFKNQGDCIQFVNTGKLGSPSGAFLGDAANLLD